MSGKQSRFNFDNWKIRTKVIALVTVAVFLAVAMVSTFNIIQVLNRMHQTTGIKLNHYQEESIQGAFEVISGSVKSLHALAISPNLVSAVQKANQQYEGQTQDEIDLNIAEWDQAWKDKDVSIEPTVKQIDESALSDYLQQFIGEFPEQVEVFVTDIQGLNIAMTDRTSDYLQADEEWWQASFNNGQGAVYVGEVEYDESSQSYAMNIGVPVVESNGNQVMGILRGTVNVSSVFANFDRIDVGKQGNIEVIDRNGVILFSRKTSDLQQQMPEAALKVVQSEEMGWKTNVISTEGDKMLSAYFTPSGDLADSLGWTVIFSENMSEIASQNVSTIIGSGIVALVSLLLAAIVGIFFANSISKPIALTSLELKRLADGDVSVKQHNLYANLLERGDETGDLWRALLNLRTYLAEVVRNADSISRGDLSVQINARGSEDALGNSLARMTSNMRAQIIQVSDNAHKLDTAAYQMASAAEQAEQATSQIAVTIQQVAKGTTQQASSISNTASSVEQMAGAIQTVARGVKEQTSAVNQASTIATQITTASQQVATNANAVSQDSAGAAEAARSGKQTVQNTLNGMQNIKSKVGLSAQKVQEMGRRSDQIGAIVETIEDIASQTNLLALNAAIEAARAGEHGKGFAVVADEVRKLAERSASSTKEIGELIRDIQMTVTEAVTAMQEGAHEVEMGVLQAQEAGQALETILSAAEAVYRQAEQAARAAASMESASEALVNAVEAVARVVEDNTLAANAMTAHSEEVAHAIENIASVSEENSAAIEEVSASTEEMSAQVEEVTASALTLSEMASALKKVVATFHLG